MISRWVWTLRTILRLLWVRVAGFALMAVVAAASAPALSRFVPEDWADALGGGAVDQVLSILASSMLAVTTFSLSIAVNTYNAAAASATPRATALLQEDQTTQTTLATFLGAFVYSVVAIIGLNAGYYDPGGRVVLFIATILVMAIVVLALLRWIGFLPDFGRMYNTLDRVEAAAQDALSARLADPWMGGHPFRDGPPDGAHPIPTGQTGYVQFIDMEALNEAAEQANAQVWLSVLPGDFVHPGAPLAQVLGPDTADEDMRAAFTLDLTRSFDQDPVFGMVVLAEIASRALSPGINDPGTAIAVIGHQVAILSNWQVREGPNVHFDRLHVPGINPGEMLGAAFRPIARDGIDKVEVMLRLLAALDALGRIAPDVYGEAITRLLEDLDDRLEQSDGLSRRDKAQIEERRRAVTPFG